jgi:CheY-like chemotaxis protein
MSRILLADDSPHAQRMGERILRDEGHEVITVSDGLVAMLRLKDAAPDIVIADISMPEVSGYELCEYIKNNGGVPVLLTAGAVEPVDDGEVARVRADGVLKKPFEATLLLEAIGRFGKRPAISPNQRDAADAANKVLPGVVRNPGPPRSVVVLDPDQVRAAITVALDAAMPAIIEEISAKVLSALAGTGRGPGSRPRSSKAEA